MNRALPVIAALALAAPALAQFTGVADNRYMWASTTQSAFVDQHPPAPFAEWESQISSASGLTRAAAFQHSDLTPGAVRAMGELDLSVRRAGAQGESRFDLTVHVPVATRYHFFGFSGGGPADFAQLIRQSDGAVLHSFAAGDGFDASGLLTPGDYRVKSGAAFDIANPLGDFSMSLSWEVYLFGTPCPADFNADGFVDFFDVDAFLACFEGGACPAGSSADFDGDGFVDFFDVDAFVAAFEQGCGE